MARGFGRSVAVLATGTAAAQAVAVVASPLLARLYTPVDFGTFGVFLAIISLGAVGVGLRFEVAIPLPEADSDALDLLVLALLVVVGMSVAIALIVWVFVSVTDPAAVPPGVRSTLWLVPPVLLLTGIFQTLTFWATRIEAFAAMSRAGIAQSASQTVGQLTLGALGGGVLGLVSGYVIGRSIGIAMLVGRVWSGRQTVLAVPSAKRLRAAATRYRRFPLVTLWSSLLNSASFQVPVLLLAALFEASVVGWFLLTVRVLQMPLTLIGSAIGQVFYARASKLNHEGLSAATSAVFRSLVTVGTGPIVLLAIGGGQMFALVFGEAWRGAGEYAQWLAPWLLVVFVASPLSTLVFVLARQRAELAFQLGLIGVRMGSLLVGWLAGSALVAVGLFGAASAALWAIYGLWLLRISGASVIDGLVHFARELAIGVALASPVLAASVLQVEGVAWAAIALIMLVIMGLRAFREVELARE